MELTLVQRQQRQNVRNFLFVATTQELYKELDISDQWRRPWVEELILERNKEIARDLRFQADGSSNTLGTLLTEAAYALEQITAFNGQVRLSKEVADEMTAEEIKEATEAGYDKLAGGWIG